MLASPCGAPAEAGGPRVMTARREVSGPSDGWGTAFAFWGTLLAAGMLFAAVSFAPKLKRLADLDAEYAANQLRLVEMERQAIGLEKVVEALEHDPAFAAELARLEFAAGRSGEERITVPEELRLGAGDGSRATKPVMPTGGRWAVPPALLGPAATHGGVRATLLAAAAALVLVAFLLLNERQAATVRAVVQKTRAAARTLTARYRTAPAPSELPAPPRKRAA